MPDSLDPVVTEALRSWRVQLESGISSSDALEMCAGMLRGSDAKSFQEASRRTSKGEGIVHVLEALKSLLTASERAILAAGWAAGRIEPTIDSLVKQRELWRDARRRILSKLVMPAGTLLIASFIVPLPGLIAGQYGVPMYLFLAALPLGLALAACIAAGVFFSTRANAQVFAVDGSPLPPSSMDRLMLATPLVGAIERQRSLAEFGDLLSNLLAAGAPIVQALGTCARAVRNGCYRREIVRLAKSASEGNSFAASLQQGPSGLWPREFCAAVTVGEQSGGLDAALARMAQNAREKYTRAIETLAEWVPKIIYGMVALYVIYFIFKFAFSYMKMVTDLMPPD